MKKVIRCFVVGACLATVPSIFAAVEAGVPPPPAGQSRLEPASLIVSHKSALSAKELAKYQQLEQESKAKTRQQAAGAGMDTTTIVIAVVIVAVVVVAVASGGGGGGGGY
jgi:hypothetical protein